MKLIVGLGNPGEKYQNNRHNVGHMFVDYVASQLTNSPTNKFKKDKYLFAEICKLATPEITLAKPITYMNESGKAVKKLTNIYQLATNDLIVVHDDLDIPLGKFRIVKGYGPKLHNGLESIENHLHSQDFLRIRIGVDNRPSGNRMPGIEYVLQDFTSGEKAKVIEQFPQIYKLLQTEHHIFLP